MRFQYLRECTAVACLALFMLTACGGPAPTNTPLPSTLPPQLGPPTPQEVKMEVTSSAFAEDAEIPKKYTCDAENVSPPLSWTAPPQGTASLVLICDDPDAPVGAWVHWVVYGLPPDARHLPEGVPPNEIIEGGAKQGRNDFRRIGYGGPCPPPGPAHRYFFKLYAVDIDLALGPGATKAEVLKAIEGHVLAEAQYMGRYKRP